MREFRVVGRSHRESESPETTPVEQSTEVKFVKQQAIESEILEVHNSAVQLLLFY